VSELCFASNLSSSEWAAWVQAVGSVLAIVVAILIPYYQGRQQRRRTREGHLETIAMDVRVSEQQAAVYLRSKIMVPAYRVPVHGMQIALPALLADGVLSGADATALAQFYVAATSFNYCLDLAQELKNSGGDWKGEVRRVKKKAVQLVPNGGMSRYSGAVAVLRKHLPESSLRRLEILPPDDDNDELLEPSLAA
jgi:hypothetical protein